MGETGYLQFYSCEGSCESFDVFFCLFVCFLFSNAIAGNFEV